MMRLRQDPQVGDRSRRGERLFRGGCVHGDVSRLYRVVMPMLKSLTQWVDR